LRKITPFFPMRFFVLGIAFARSLNRWSSVITTSTLRGSAPWAALPGRSFTPSATASVAATTAIVAGRRPSRCVVVARSIRRRTR
jgi:hypothetical protein